MPLNALLSLPSLGAPLGGAGLLASSSPLDHVVDKPLGDGLLWHHGDGSVFEGFFGALASVGLGKHAFLFLVAGVLTILFFAGHSRRVREERVPGRWGSFVEMVLEFLRDQMLRPFLGTAGDRYLPLIATFFVYIAVCNLMGLVPLLDFLGHGGNTATGSLTITAGLAVCSFCIYHYLGIREQGSVVTYVKNLFPHVPLFVYPVIIPIELIAHVIRPCALAIRLFANMLAGHTMMGVFVGFTVAIKASFLTGAPVTLAAVIAMTLLTFLELLVALIQAFVFTFLTTVFLSMAVHPEH